MISCLKGIRILDASRILAGPFASQVLGEYGAEILKVEFPGAGDDTRGWGPPFENGTSAYFQSCNRNKKSLELNLKNPIDHHRFLELLARADVYLDNFLPEPAKRLGLEPEFFDKFPTLVTARISSFPLESDRAGEKGYDLMFQAESGYMACSGPDDGPPSKLGFAVIDVLTGLLTSQAILAGLLQRERQGHAPHIHISLWETAHYCMVNVISGALMQGQNPHRFGNAHPHIVPYQAFGAQDGDVVVGAGNDMQYQRLCELLELNLPSNWTNAERIQNRKKIVKEIQDKVSTHKVSELMTLLRKAGIPCAPILGALEAIQQLPGQIVAIPNKDSAQFVPRFSVRVDGQASVPSLAPELGEGGLQMAERWLK